jgi:hypothetical protein
MKQAILVAIFSLFFTFSLQAQTDTFAWISKGLTFSLPQGCEIVADDSVLFQARKHGFSITLQSFTNSSFDLLNQAEITQEAAKQVGYDKMENVEFFYLPNFKCCSISGSKNSIKIMILSLLNHRDNQHFSAVIIYSPDIKGDIENIVKSFWKRS